METSGNTSGRMVTMSDYFFRSNRLPGRITKGTQLKKLFFLEWQAAKGVEVALAMKTRLFWVFLSAPVEHKKNIKN